MYRNHTIGVVIPAYNEGRFVGNVIRTVPDYVDRVYVVDDGSTDDTWEEMRAAASDENERRDTDAAFDRVIVPIQHPENRGVGGAIKTGYKRAREDRVEVTAVMGGDGQMRPEHLPVLLDPIVDDRADYAKGNRLLGPETYGNMPRFRLVGNYLLSLLTKVASGYWGIGDPQNGYTAISLCALEAIDLEDLYEFYGYCNDLLVKLNVEGFRVADIPRRSNYAEEDSHIELSSYVPRVSFMLLGNFFWRLREQYRRDGPHPDGIAYVAALALGVGGVLREVRRGFRRGVTAGIASGVQSMIVAAAAFVAGAVLDRRRHADRAVAADADLEHLDGEDPAEPDATPPGSTAGQKEEVEVDAD